ncbi:multidrug resistance-associated protein 1-like [Littorina saxatilis]|uniref:multidrug resistance-associated protein 1-like n=1 Tax=Littorina saxatilis TaxID=31220 RepID=UPI0038B6395C
MNSEARRESTVGEIVNLMSVDARNLEMYATYSFWLWMSPIWIIVALYLLYTTVGVSMFAGLGFMALLFAANTYLMNKMRIYQKTIMKIRDKRVKVINEILNGIKILKLYAWEPSFEDKVGKIRNEELGVLLKSSLVGSFITFAWTAAMYWMTLLTFMTYVFVDESHNLTASTSFVALSYFNIIRLAVNVLPIMIREGVKSVVSLGRINRYLNTPDLDTSNVTRDSTSDNAIDISDGTFSWDTDTAPTLRDITLRVKRGSLVAVVGQVGTGKSSLVSAMLGEMETVTGHISVSGSVAYVPQQAWIQNDTLRNNVLFGQDFDHQRYHRVLDACALRPDLDILAAGDLTEIGEKGINLSGGQKQRVSVARAVYSDADVILLDDPLSAVDSHVGKQIFNEVINQGGILHGKTRVLVTHGLQWLPKVDTIVVLSQGTISEMGSYEDLMSHDGAFAQFLTNYLTQHDEESDEEEDEEAQIVKRDILQRLVSRESDTESGTDETAKGRILQRLKRWDGIFLTFWVPFLPFFFSFFRESESDHHDVRRRKRSRGLSESVKGSAQGDKGKKEVADTSKIMTEEEMESGRVDKGVYLELAKALGFRYSLVMLVLFTIYNVAALGGNLWLSVWTDDAELSNLTALPPDSDRRRELNDFYLGIYAALGLAQTVFVVIYAVIMAFRQIHASRLMHRRMLERIMRAPMSFFDTTPLGRIVNRFSQDMDMLDSEICLDVEIWVDNVEQVLSTVIAISYTTPIFLAVFAPAFLVYFFVMRFYVGTSCQIRRLQSKKRSPIYSHFGESLTGATVIRAYGAQQRFIQQSQHRVDALFTCSYNANAAARWLGVRLDFIGSILILAAGLFTVGSRDTLSAGIVGLSLSYALEVTGKMNMVVRMSTEMETNIVSLERIAEYTNIQSEAPWSAIPRPKPDWPQRGHLRFHGYSSRYRPGLDLVIRDLTCDFNPGEKVGIVGRTGAGKSSMTLALFRLIEPAAGNVTVDDVDIASLGLHDLRQKLNILPQDPVIFDGTIRMNLNPLGGHSDDQVWTALQQAHLSSYVRSLPDGLDHVCGEGGENLSMGQRQLLCLARALLRKTKILVLDEATAAVDMETDDLIQTTIRQAFNDCTILTIAHRINTVMDYDRILVLDSGRMVECDSPSSLLADPSTAFYKMAKDAGLV